MKEFPFFFTWAAQKHAKPVELTGGKGAWFSTTDGARWLDLGSLIYQANLGHGHARVIEAVRSQASRMCLAIPGAVYPEKIDLANKLLSLAGPRYSKVFFTLGGSDANENALKIARMATGRYKAISRYQSYHGATMGAVTLSGDWRRLVVEPGVVGVVHVDDWTCVQCPFEVRARTCTHAPPSRIPTIMEREGPRSIAAVFVESVPGANGVLIAPPGYFRALREACDTHGAFLVVDEVLTGFGRTGRWFGFQHFDGVEPDMITIGKALTGGYGVLGGVIVHERVAGYFDEHVLAAGLTHYAHPLGVAAALEALKVYEEERLIERGAQLEPILRDELTSIQKRLPSAVRDVRVIGALAALDLVGDSTKWNKLSHALRKRFVHVHVQEKSGVLIVSPPLCIEEADLRSGLNLVSQAVEEAWA